MCTLNIDAPASACVLELPTNLHNIVHFLEKVPTWAVALLKAPTCAFTIKILLIHLARCEISTRIRPSRALGTEKLCEVSLTALLCCVCHIGIIISMSMINIIQTKNWHWTLIIHYCFYNLKIFMSQWTAELIYNVLKHKRSRNCSTVPGLGYIYSRQHLNMVHKPSFLLTPLPRCRGEEKNVIRGNI